MKKSMQLLIILVFFYLNTLSMEHDTKMPSLFSLALNKTISIGLLQSLPQHFIESIKVPLNSLDQNFYSSLNQLEETNHVVLFLNKDNKVDQTKLNFIASLCKLDQTYKSKMENYLKKKLRATNIGWKDEVPDQDKPLIGLYLSL